MDRVDVQPEVLRWARERAGLGIDALAGRFAKLPAWERGEIRPTLKQLGPENSWRVPIPVQTQEPPCGTSAVLTITCATTEALA